MIEKEVKGTLKIPFTCEFQSIELLYETFGLSPQEYRKVFLKKKKKGIKIIIKPIHLLLLSESKTYFIYSREAGLYYFYFQDYTVK